MAVKAEHGDECTQPRGKRTKQHTVSTVLYSYPTAALKSSALHTSDGSKLCLATNETPREMLEHDEKVTVAIFLIRRITQLGTGAYITLREGKRDKKESG